MPGKNAHGTDRKFDRSFKNTKLHKPPPTLKEPRKVQSVLAPLPTTNYTPHPSLSIENPQRKCILSLLKLLRLLDLKLSQPQFMVSSELPL